MEKKQGMWRFLRTPSAKYSLLTLLVVGFFAGIIFWGLQHRHGSDEPAGILYRLP